MKAADGMQLAPIGDAWDHCDTRGSLHTVGTFDAAMCALCPNRSARAVLSSLQIAETSCK
jgi:hypothetical protein